MNSLKNLGRFVQELIQQKQNQLLEFYDQDEFRTFFSKLSPDQIALLREVASHRQISKSQLTQQLKRNPSKIMGLVAGITKIAHGMNRKSPILREYRRINGSWDTWYSISDPSSANG